MPRAKATFENGIFLLNNQFYFYNNEMPYAAMLAQDTMETPMEIIEQTL